jgi:hypothetical protein
MNTKVFLAVAAALAASAPAFALPVQASLDAPTQLTVSGASAARDAFLVLMKDHLCASGFTAYRAVDTGGSATGKDFRAYSCHLINDTDLLPGIANTDATVYYRAEGGSAWGPVPIATSTSVYRLKLDSTCTATSTFSYQGSTAAVNFTGTDCVVADYNLDTDVSTSPRLQKDTVDLGVSDLEPKMFGGKNFPTSTVFPAATDVARQGQLNTLNGSAEVGFGQVFGVIVNNVATGKVGSPRNGVYNGNGTAENAMASPFNTQVNPALSRSTIAAIFAGTYKNWNQVPKIDGTLVTTSDITIRVCRREPGSGTQVGAAQFFLNTKQCGGTTDFVADVDTANDADKLADSHPLTGDTNGVIERGTSSDLNSCVGGLAGGIGILVAGSAPSNTTMVALDGIIPSRNGAAVGNYQYTFELTFAKNSAAGANELELATAIVQDAQNQAQAPNVSSVFALPNDFNTPATQTAFVTTKPPIAFATRGGNSCKTPAAVLP